MTKPTSSPGRIPWVTVATMIVCTALMPYGELLSLKPAFVMDAFAAHGENIGTALLSFVAYMLQHSSFGRFEENIFFFVLCGFFLEREIGPWRFAVFVLATGIGAGLVHVLMLPSLSIGVIGLSGVTIGLLAVTAWAGRALIKIDWLVLALRVFAFVIVVLQLYGYYFGQGMQHGDSNGYTLHLGSAVSALLLYFFWLRKRLNGAIADTTFGPSAVE